MPVNTNQIFPMPTGDNLNVPNVSFMQFFSPYAGVILGKLATSHPHLRRYERVCPRQRGHPVHERGIQH